MKNKLTCKRLLWSNETFHLIVPFFFKEHVRKWTSDYFKNIDNLCELFGDVYQGYWRIYAVFDENDKILGFELAALDRSGEAIVCHSYWDRHVPALECVLLCEKEAVNDYKQNDDIDLKYTVGYIPDIHRASRWLAKRFGSVDMGIRHDMIFQKGDEIYPCREFRKKIER